MCNSEMKTGHAIDGRAVLQPACNRVVVQSDAVRPFKKSLPRSISEVCPANKKLYSPPVSPMPKPAYDPNSLNSSTEKPVTPKKSAPPLVRKKPNKSSSVEPTKSLPYSCESPGSVAAAQRELASLAQVQRRMRIAHYGRTPAKLAASPVGPATAPEEKRCSFITANSDPIFVAYHDEEWGVLVHDDNMMFELLVLSGLQVGLDWTTILKKRNELRSAFAGFDAEVVAGFTDRQIGSISTYYGLDISKVRVIVDNSSRILEVMKDFGSFSKYVWGFVNHKPIATNYKSCRKIPIKTSKSESISKDMVRRGFRLVGPTVVHSFMQAAGLTNDHLVSCPRHLHCSTLSH